MYGSPATSKDLDLSFSDLHSQHQHQHQMSSGLLRYRSAPSSLFGEACDDFLPSEPEAVLARFLSSDLGHDKPAAAAVRGSPRYPPPLPLPLPPPDPCMVYPQQRQQLPAHGLGEQLKSEPALGLARQTSSPAGLFPHLNLDNSSSSNNNNNNNGYALMRSMSGGAAAAAATAAANRLKNQISFSSRQGSLMSQISEIGSDGMGASSPEESSLATNTSGGGGGRCYIPGYHQVSSWDGSSMLADSFSDLKRAREAGLDQSEPQNGEIRSNVSGQLAHQFSLPKTSSELAAMEKFLQFQDAVPCKIRAKRGCATHPRSIAERVRRTRISERMRKLQELVPNMDKQTNTADMLDLAVEYIKELQREAKSLSESRASCTCSSGMQKPYAQV